MWSHPPRLTKGAPNTRAVPVIIFGAALFFFALGIKELSMVVRHCRPVQAASPDWELLGVNQRLGADGRTRLTCRLPGGVFAPYRAAELDVTARKLDKIMARIIADAMR
jgi:hypothetical protein